MEFPPGGKPCRVLPDLYSFMPGSFPLMLGHDYLNGNNCPVTARIMPKFPPGGNFRNIHACIG